MGRISTSKPTIEWTVRLAFDVALMLEGSGTTSDILDDYGLTKRDLVRICKDKIFGGQVENYRGQIRENGLSFKVKARVQAEQLLETGWDLIHNPATSAAVKADLIKSVIKWAGLSGESNRLGVDNLGTIVPSITINLVSPTKTERVVDGEVIDGS